MLHTGRVVAGFVATGFLPVTTDAIVVFGIVLPALVLFVTELVPIDVTGVAAFKGLDALLLPILVTALAGVVAMVVTVAGIVLIWGL